MFNQNCLEKIKFQTSHGATLTVTMEPLAATLGLFFMF